MFSRAPSSRAVSDGGRAQLLALLVVPACALVAGLEDKEFHTAPIGGAGAGSPAAGEGGGAIGVVSSHAGDATGGQVGTSGGRSGAPDTATQGGAPGSGGQGEEPDGSGGERARPPSCASDEPGAGNNCGLSGTEDCCDSPLVEGGPFDRFNDANQPFTVSAFRLDRFEVTVGRFRQFVRAVEAGFRPEPGDGKHVHLNGGAAPGEVGWLPAFDEFVTESVENCPNDNYSSSPGPTDKQPVVCASYYHALAFCIWDGGYLPSSTELLYVLGGGGGETRGFPWGDTLEPSRAVYATSKLADVGTKPDGEGRWGHHDLIGNAWEIAADNQLYYHGCSADCAYIDEEWGGLIFGWSFESSSALISDGNHGNLEGRDGNDETGFRCARAP